MALAPTVRADRCRSCGEWCSQDDLYYTTVRLRRSGIGEQLIAALLPRCTTCYAVAVNAMTRLP